MAEIFGISIRIDQGLLKLNGLQGEERFRVLLNLANEATRLREECLNEAVDMDLSTEHNIEAHNVARAGAHFDPLRRRSTRQG